MFKLLEYTTYRNGTIIQTAPPTLIVEGTESECLDEYNRQPTRRGKQLKVVAP